MYRGVCWNRNSPSDPIEEDLSRCIRKRKPQVLPNDRDDYHRLDDNQMVHMALPIQVLRLVKGGRQKVCPQRNYNVILILGSMFLLSDIHKK